MWTVTAGTILGEGDMENEKKMKLEINLTSYSFWQVEAMQPNR